MSPVVDGPAAGPALLQVHAGDSVAVCLRDVAAGERVALGEGVIQISVATPRGHKIALQTRTGPGMW